MKWKKMGRNRKSNERKWVERVRKGNELRENGKRLKEKKNNGLRANGELRKIMNWENMGIKS